jgi:PAS domain S-box-containing protein
MRTEILKRLVAESALELMGHVPDTYFWAKDHVGRFVAANSAFVKGCGLKHEEDLVGLTDFDVWPRQLAEGYRRDDRWVMSHGKPIVNKLELSKNSTGGTDWFSTTKMPLRDRRGVMRGVAGIARDVKKGHDSFRPYMEMSETVSFITANYASTLSLKTLADKAAMSPSKFERRFKKILGSTPTDFIRSIRIQAASRLLAEGSLSISEVGYKTGFYDHSHFNRIFSKKVGMSPTQYRNAHAYSPNRPLRGAATE